MTTALRPLAEVVAFLGYLPPLLVLAGLIWGSSFISSSWISNSASIISTSSSWACLSEAENVGDLWIISRATSSPPKWAESCCFSAGVVIYSWKMSIGASIANSSAVTWTPLSTVSILISSVETCTAFSEGLPLLRWVLSRHWTSLSYCCSWSYIKTIFGSTLTGVFTFCWILSMFDMFARMSRQVVLSSSMKGKLYCLSN